MEITKDQKERILERARAHVNDRLGMVVNAQSRLTRFQQELEDAQAELALLERAMGLVTGKEN